MTNKLQNDEVKRTNKKIVTYKIQIDNIIK